MKKKIQLQLFLDKSREREYIRLPFSVDADTESISIRYRYPSSFAGQDGPFVIEGEPCTIDLAVMMPDGRMAGSSGSDRSSILISPLGSSAGFQSCELPEGTWHIIAGAYHIPANGVAVEYEVEVTPKERRLFKGDTHVHTTASDGILKAEEAALLARRMGLDFLIFTDHNNSAQNDRFPFYEDITLIPGTEWTHYKGHAGFLGTEQAFSTPFFTASLEETRDLFKEAGENGAFRVINHPFCRWFPGNGIFLCPSTVWRYGMASCPSGMKRQPSGGISSFAPAGSCRLPAAVIIIVPVFWAASPCPASVCMPLPVPGRIC